MAHKPKTSEQALKNLQTLCARQEKCAFDIEKKLKDWGFDSDISQEMITFLEQEKFIDEQRYAQAFANDRLRYYGWGKNKIKYYLKQKKIAEKQIEKALANLDPVEYEKKFNEIMNRKLITLQEKDVELFNLKKKMTAFALNRGFEGELVYGFVNKI